MSSDKFLNKYRIPSARYKWHDYNAGLYFITICTHNMEHYFGEITSPHSDDARRDDVHIVSTKTTENETTNEPIMHFTEIGKFADENLKQIQTHYPYCEIPVFVVMSNHIHAIVVIDDDNCNDDDCKDDMHIVSTETSQNPQRWKNETVDEKMQSVSHKRGRLSIVIGGFKRAITRYANQNQISFKWQTRFYDRIIRDQNECNRIATYIENNPYNWLQDKFYTE